MDITHAKKLLKCLCNGSLGAVHAFTIEGKPHSKGRPRFARGRAYMAKADRLAEKATVEQLQTHFQVPLEGALAVGCLFFRPDKRRVDLDNLEKHLNDSMNKVCFLDDSQIQISYAVLGYDKERPRTVVVIGELDD